MNIKLRHSIWGRLCALIFGGLRQTYVDADIVACTVEDAARDEVMIVWAWNLDATSIPDVSAFSLTGKTITNVAVAGGLVTLTVSVAYDFGDVPGDVVYTAPALNPLKEESTGAIVNDFTEPVTNYISYPTALDDANHWWYDATDLATITKDGSDLVSDWAAKGGAKTGKNLLQATGTNQPLWVTPGTIRFDGVDNFLKSAAFTWNQPEFIYMLIKQITWTSLDRLFDGNVTNGGALFQYPDTPKLRIYAGGSGIPTDGVSLTLDTWAIIRVLFNGAASKLIVDNNTPGTGDPGANNMGGFTLGARGAANSYWSNIEVKDIVCCNTTDAANETEIYNWLVTRKP